MSATHDQTIPEDADVLVVGAGPAGSTAALRLAEAGHRVVAVDRRRDRGERQRSGALLSARAVHQLAEVGIDAGRLASAHRIERFRFRDAASPSNSVSVTWPPSVPTSTNLAAPISPMSNAAGASGLAELTTQNTFYPTVGYIVDRRELDQVLGDAAISAGAELQYGIEATGPIVERGFVRGALVARSGEHRSIRSDYTVVADGADSRFGRALGTFRTRGWPYALGHRGRYESPLSGAHEAEFVLGLRDESGQPIAGYGWMFPCGDGTVVVGVLVMSTSSSFRVLRPERLLERAVTAHRDRWQLGAEPVAPTGGGRLPLGNSIGPVAGPTYLVVGDAAGAANPFTGIGLEYAIETGGAAAQVLHDALVTGTAAELQRYPAMLDERYGSYYKLGRLTNRMIANAAIAPRFADIVSKHRWAADTMMRIAYNELGGPGGRLAELIVAAGRAIDAFSPSA